MSETFYNILEVSDTASIDEIKKSYRRLSNFKKYLKLMKR
jgi:DnaJ-class molecular chaperone